MLQLCCKLCVWVNTFASPPPLLLLRSRGFCQSQAGSPHPDRREGCHQNHEQEGFRSKYFCSPVEGNTVKTYTMTSNGSHRTKSPLSRWFLLAKPLAHNSNLNVEAQEVPLLLHKFFFWILFHFDEKKTVLKIKKKKIKAADTEPQDTFINIIIWQ